jgi:hypothetical protein
MSPQPPDPRDQGSHEGTPPGWGQPPVGPPAPYQPLPYPTPPTSGPRLAASLGGFFSGVAWLFVIPAVTVGIGASLWPDFAGPGLAFTALVTVGGPLALLFSSRTRRFGAFMLIGMAVTLIVLAGVCAAFFGLLVLNGTG